MKYIKLISVLLTMAIIASLSPADVHAQKGRKVNLATDTLDLNSAIFRKSDYKKLFEGKGRKKVTETVSFDVETLKQIVDACTAKGIKDLKFQFAVMRQEDVAGYVRKHPEQALTQDQQDDLVERPTLLIRVPRTVVNALASNAGTPTDGSASANRNDGGMEGGSAMSDSYLDVGSICPPPAQCDE